jgi:DNA-binding response OmpR family regulator
MAEHWRITESSPYLHAGTVCVDFSSGNVFVGSRIVRLPEGQLRLLVTMMRSEGRVLSRDELRSAGWDEEVHLRSVDREIQRLKQRLALPPTKCPIKSLRGFGYGYFVRKKNVRRTPAHDEREPASEAADASSGPSPG